MPRSQENMMAISTAPNVAEDASKDAATGDKTATVATATAQKAPSDTMPHPPSRVVLCSLQYRRRLQTFSAFLGFGLVSWIMTNAAYVELGVFLRVLPETYGIFAYSIFALQSANIYPFLYMLLNARQQRVKHTTTIWWLLAIGTIVALLMSLLWRETAVVFGKEHSVAMLILTHLGGLVSATSSVVFYPYVATFPPIYTSGLSTGEGLSGSIAALLGIIQRPYDAKAMRFSVDTFYVLCAFIMALSLISFWFLERHPVAKAAKHPEQHLANRGELPTHQPHNQTTEASPLVVEPRVHELSEVSMCRALAPVWAYLLCQLLLAAFSFGVLPSVMPYVYKKYAPESDREQATARYQTLASIASLILDPFARLLTSWVRIYRVREFTAVLLAVAITLLVFSLQAEPLASSASSGFVLPLTAHVGYLVAYAYTQTMVYLTLKRISDTSPALVPAQRVYQWSGFATQIGAFLGTLVIFPLVYLDEHLFFDGVS